MQIVLREKLLHSNAVDKRVRRVADITILNMFIIIITHII
jgi:hypothetical protein